MDTKRCFFFVFIPKYIYIYAPKKLVPEQNNKTKIIPNAS